MLNAITFGVSPELQKKIDIVKESNLQQAAKDLQQASEDRSNWNFHDRYGKLQEEYSIGGVSNADKFSALDALEVIYEKQQEAKTPSEAVKVSNYQAVLEILKNTFNIPQNKLVLLNNLLANLEGGSLLDFRYYMSNSESNLRTDSQGYPLLDSKNLWVTVSKLGKKFVEYRKYLFPPEKK